MSDRSEQINQEGSDLLNSLESPLLQSQALAIQNTDAMEDLKYEILGFFKNRIAAIARSERIKELVFQQLEQDIQGGGLNFDQMMTLLMRLGRDNNESADSIISMFRNAGGGNNGGSLLTDIVRPASDKSEIVKAFDSYTPEELRKINETFKVIRDIVESGGNVSIETPDGKIPVAEV